MQLRTAVVEKKLQTVFYAFGLLIGRRPWSVIASVIVLVALSSIGLLNFEQTNNAKTEFTPISAPSRDELAAVEKFLQQNGTLFLVNMMI
uniref:RND transporter n=1 Tax=Plectus sambesii TaxID=2011161 RepID=A0A914VWW7_9BILA